MRYKLPLIALLLIALVAVPPLFGGGVQYALVNALIASLFAAAFNLLMGQGGMLSFGHAAYFGIGAFAVLHLMQAVEYGYMGVPTVLLPLAGGLAGLIGGLFAGYFATMRAGVYFSLVTLALAELLFSLAPHWEGIFGGEAGLSSMRMPWLGFNFGTTLEVYYLTLVWVVLCLAVLYAYTLTPFGRLTQALRDNSQRIRYMGYNAHTTKVVVFAISTTFAGIAGGLMAMSNETANYSIFSTHISAEVVLYTFVGGSTVFFGPIIGASIFTLFGFVVSGATNAWLLYQGLIFVLVMLFAPKGIGGLIQAHIDQRHRLPWARLPLPYAVLAGGGVFMSLAVVFFIQSFEHVLSNRYQAVVARTGEWPDYHLFGASWDPLSPVTWLVPLILFVPGVIIVRKAAACIHEMWEGQGADVDKSEAAPATSGGH